MSAIAPSQSTQVPNFPAAGRVPYRIRVDLYETIVRTGLFTERDNVELIEGQLVKKITEGTRHSAGVTKCWRTIDRAMPAGWHVRVETPVRIPARDSSPEPEVSVARGTADDYLQLDPAPADVALVVEVSDTNLEADRAMAVTYGCGGIPAYWIVDVAGRRLVMYSDPVAGAYPPPTIRGEAESVDLIIAGQVAARISVADLLPRHP